MSRPPAIACCGLGDALGLTETAASTLGKDWQGKNIRHRLLDLLRQAAHGRLAGYEPGRSAIATSHRNPPGHNL